MKFKKSLGQNLLIDKNILRKIVSVTSLNKKNVLEIGSGTGNLSNEILKCNPKKLICIEKDKNFSINLKEKFKAKKNFTIINDDILKINLKRILLKDMIIVGNLPYNISSQILIKFIRVYPWPPKFSKLILMFQKEMGEKIIAKIGNSDYSRISIITNSRFKILRYFYVSKSSFFPKPKVDSIVIEFEPIIKKTLKLKSIKTLEFITNTFFSNRRKMVNKVFKKLKIDDKDFIKSQKIDLSLRPEKLTIEQYFKISEYYEKLKLK